MRSSTWEAPAAAAGGGGAAHAAGGVLGSSAGVAGSACAGVLPGDADLVMTGVEEGFAGIDSL